MEKTCIMREKKIVPTAFGSRYVFALFESNLEFVLLFLSGIDELTQNDVGNANALAIYPTKYRIDSSCISQVHAILIVFYEMIEIKNNQLFPHKTVTRLRANNLARSVNEIHVDQCFNPLTGQ